MDLSIVIPAFNEEDKIVFDVETAARFIQDTCDFGEVIVVDDGSTDQTSSRARRASVPDSVTLKVLRLKRNMGKGAAVRDGIQEASGEVILYADSGTCIPYTDASLHIEKIRNGELDMAIASRRHRDTVIRRNRPLYRRFLSRLFRLLARLITGLPGRISDSQCGFKVFAKDAAKELFTASLIPGFMFEIEILLRAIKKGYSIEEFPVEWSCDLDTRLRPGTEALSVIRELFQVRKAKQQHKTQGE